MPQSAVRLFCEHFALYFGIMHDKIVSETFCIVPKLSQLFITSEYNLTVSVTRDNDKAREIKQKRSWKLLRMGR